MAGHAPAYMYLTKGLLFGANPGLQSGEDVTFGVNAKHLVRQRARCLACIRKENGWQHQPGCPGPDDHRGPCSAIEQGDTEFVVPAEPADSIQAGNAPKTSAKPWIVRLDGTVADRATGKAIGHVS